MGLIQAVVFDFDGLLVDSEPLQIRAWDEFLARYDRVLEPEMLDEMFGKRVRDSAELIQARLEIPLTPQAVMDQRDEIFLELIQSELPLMPGARDLIDALEECDDLRLALATSGHRRYINVALRNTDLAETFDAIVTGDDVERGKPHPDIYAAAAEKLQLPPSKCLALEDAPHGIRSAKAAGMYCLAIPNEMTRPLPGLDEADAVLDSLSDVLPWLGYRGQGIGYRG